jgi:prophage DNA circulation protein
LLGLGQSLALAEAARLAPTADFESREEAIAVRDAIADGLDEQAEAAATDSSFAALVDLRATLVRSVPGEDHALPRLLSHTPAYTVPSLVLAYRLYGDTASEADIIARNRIRHPGFIAGGEPLEILSRE